MSGQRGLRCVSASKSVDYVLRGNKRETSVMRLFSAAQRRSLASILCSGIVSCIPWHPVSRLRAAAQIRLHNLTVRRCKRPLNPCLELRPLRGRMREQRHLARRQPLHQRYPQVRFGSQRPEKMVGRRRRATGWSTESPMASTAVPTAQRRFCAAAGKNGRPSASPHLPPPRVQRTATFSATAPEPAAHKLQ